MGETMGMTISVASGKGGTGKTLIATSLIKILADRQPLLCDADVEEPNAGLFLPLPEKVRSAPVSRPVPAVDWEACTQCGICAQICQFGALAVLPQEMMTFPELCHSCGACSGLCPTGAMREENRLIGQIEQSTIDNLGCLVTGRLEIGESLSPPLIKAVKSHAAPVSCTVIDCPPGTTCPMIEAIRGSDYCLLVTEPTPFGRHDLALALEACQMLNLSAGVLVNRWQGEDDAGVRKVADQYGVPILGYIPFSSELARAYARGEDPLEALPELKVILGEVIRKIEGGGI